jgi:hypothetical protein
LSNTALKLTEKIETGEKSLNDFEFKNVANMKIYLKGAIKKGLLNVKQEISNYVLSYETITTIDNEIVKFENEKAFNQIMDYKNSKGKDIFTLLRRISLVDGQIFSLFDEPRVDIKMSSYRQS